MVDIEQLKRNVFPGESGGDYDALYGYSNRAGGAFAGVRPSQMTVAQVLDLTDPRGPYAQWSRQQLGYTATPVGAYQVVGSTLRDAVKGMGLTGNEMFDENTQDQIGAWIYQTQGPGAWEGWGKGGGGGGSQISRSTKGGASMRGLLDTGEVPEPNQGGIVRLLTGENKPWASTVNDIGAVLLALSGSPAAEPLMARLSERRGERREIDQQNRTLQFLQNLGTPEAMQAMQYAQATGDIMGAAKIALQPAQQPYRQITGAELGLTGEDASRLYNVAPDGQVTAIGGGGQNISIDTGARGEFEDAFANNDADRLALVEDVGLAATRSLASIGQLESILATAPQGLQGGIKLLAGQIGINTEGLGDLQAAEAIINGLVPQQRPPGSGPMSDADLALFKRSLPRIINQPGGNQQILGTMRAIAQYDAEGAQIVQELRQGVINRSQAFERLLNRPDPLSAVRSLMDGSAAPGGAPSGSAPRVRTYNPVTDQLE